MKHLSFSKTIIIAITLWLSAVLFTASPAAVALPPTVTTNAASGVGTTGATLNGTVNANNSDTTVTFEYGLDTNYGTTVTADQSPVSGIFDTAVSNAISGLTSNTTYHYRVYATNAGGTAYGIDISFTTQEAPPPTDSDHDGLPDSQEQGPDGDNPNYDGNFDGTPDWQQGNAASFNTLAQDGSSHYITLEVPEGQRIEYPYAYRSFDTPPPFWVSLPYGFFGFKNWYF